MEKKNYCRAFFAVGGLLLLIGVVLCFGKKRFPEGKTEAQRLSYLSNIGFFGEETENREIRLPAACEENEGYYLFFDELGVDLKPYAGEPVTLYSYVYKDWKKFSEEFFADLIVYRESILGTLLFSSDKSGISCVYSEENFKNLEFSK